MQTQKNHTQTNTYENQKLKAMRNRHSRWDVLNYQKTSHTISISESRK